MKAKKARKRLRRVEDLLTTVIEKYSTPKPTVQELLGTAKTAVSGAITNLQPPVKKPPVRAPKARQQSKRPAAKAAAACQELHKAV